MDAEEPIQGTIPIDAVKAKPPLTEGISVGTTTPTQEPSQKIEQVKKELTNPRVISKKHDQEGRNETARTILEARTSAKITKERILGSEKKGQGVAETATNLYQQERQKAAELAQRLESVLVRLKNTVGLGDKQAVALQIDIDTLKAERDALAVQSLVIEEELKGLRQRQAEIPDPKKLLEAYYEKKTTQPLTNEEKRELLKPEVLASLSTQEYIALWRRLNPYFLSHVTREGFRDHNAMVYHSVGMKEFHNGFSRVVDDQKMLRPPLALHGLPTRDEATVKNYLNGWVLQAENEDEARQRLSDLLIFHLADAPKYPDETAVHFAAQLVADHYYGGESGNEVFFIYPTDVLASQYNFAFNGWEKDFTKPQSETKWNDVFVWPQTLDNPGISLDSGFVFLPELTPVDRQTGSKYASEVKVVNGQEKRVMVEDTKLVSSFIE